jgi:O-acetyl-ADP-ribose deacetylase (regulator of RNase III)
VPLNVFICYKKVLTQEQQDQRPGILQFHLKNAKAQLGEYDAFIDEADLVGGMVWESEIYRNILRADAMLVVIGVGTSKSEWVKREIALANALGITVIPLGEGLTTEEMTAEMKELGIDRFQWKITHNLNLNTGNALVQELQPLLYRAAEQTKRQQSVTLRELFDRRNVRPPKAQDNQRAAVFSLRCKQSVMELCIGSGDIAKFRGIDVLVNSENDYMQMARFFESRTVSSILRQYGAVQQNGRFEDTIQTELDWQLQGRWRPVVPGEVFATSSGRPESRLAALLKARYVLHVAAVQAVLPEATVVPFKTVDQIDSCVRGCLTKLVEINAQRGIISPPDTVQRQEQESRAAKGDDTVRSILFPLFGTGRGGADAAHVLPAMLSGILGFFQDSEDGKLSGTLRQIYICVYTAEDLAVATEFFSQQLPSAMGQNA